ncbi:MAG TPA: hypothetical protein VGB55_14350 [Tepidisphaeraceae bacterium]|jgi:hypothetical protein
MLYDAGQLMILNQPSLYLHPERLTPDPTYGYETRPLPGGFSGATYYPHRLLRAAPTSPQLQAWGGGLDLFRDPGPVTLHPDESGRAELVVDFGTELDAAIEVDVESAGPRLNVGLWRGESWAEAEGTVYGQVPHPYRAASLPGPGRRTATFEIRGLRFVRLVIHDMTGPVTLHGLRAQAVFAFDQRDGDFTCSDARFQRVWQTSAYTARLCTRPDTLWDGIKRDRVGWFGDGRIIKLATDNVFFRPEPAEQMLLGLPTDSWANAVPNYSFDAVSMLRQHVLTYGLDRACVRPAFERVRQMLAWCESTQCDDGGFVVLRDDQSYFFKIGFVDWSLMPVGGRFEELSWLQCKYIEALRDAAVLARWLGHDTDARHYDNRAARISRRVVEMFWRDGVGVLHTLNHVGEVDNPHLPGYDGHYQKSYVDGIRLGPSGPTRQSNALAVMAGVLDEAQRNIVLRRVFNSPDIAPVITAYFAYYEQTARALCGDPAGAIQQIRDYVSDMLERESAATLWEIWSHDVNDHRKYSSHYDLNWPYPNSLCHGWGAGAIPLATRHLLGIESTAPGFTAVRLNPALDVPWAYHATVPTPLGPITAERDAPGAPVQYRLPKGMQITGAIPQGAVVAR